ncbi:MULTISPECIES: DUF1501 domain-containing protein [Polynucleobacter]|nr:MULTISPECIES: DUF1501 domain-containing protein [Polynucleobacter]MBU3552507.1 DUF1501 domain-containing protein [Polynucleobacter sp. MWH-Post4-6-1]MBU3611239.1 DUF1501 domain-containing protein [Polynucleobacter wuianus]
MNLSLKRREFLKAASCAGCFTPALGIQSLAWGHSGSESSPLLLTVFLRGGADGLNFVSPVNDVNFVDARAQELRVLESGSQAGFLLKQTLSPHTGFYLHREAGAFAELYNSKYLAVVHSAGINDATRSHFVAQLMIERGVGDTSVVKNTQASTSSLGWMTKALNALPQYSNQINAYAASSILPVILEGSPTVLVAPDLHAGLGTPWLQPAFGLPMEILNTDKKTIESQYQDLYRASKEALYLQAKINQSFGQNSYGKTLPYKPSGAANYQVAGSFGRSLASIAHLAKTNVGLRLANVSLGGWDTHDSQPSRFSNAVRLLSSGLGSFYEDMTASNKSVIIVIMTEFGRRVRPNKSNGTDHGHGACWFVIGDKVKGGNFIGRWPGLNINELDQGVDLAVTTDYRQIIFESLVASGLDSNKSLSDWQAESTKNPLGLFDKKV